MAKALTTDCFRRAGALCGVAFLSATLVVHAAGRGPEGDEARRILEAAGKLRAMEGVARRLTREDQQR